MSFIGGINKLLRNSLFKRIVSVGLALVFVYIAFGFLLNEDHKQLLYSISATNHIISGVFLIISFLISGFEIKYVYNRTAKLNLSHYDVISLPYVINLWGYIIPIQGSFLYFLMYLKLKYKYEIQDTFYIYVYMFLVSLSFFGLVGSIMILFTDYFSLTVFIFLLSLCLLPALFFVGNYILTKFNFIPSFLRKVTNHLKYVVNNINLLFGDYRMVIMLMFYKTAIILINTTWAYWICQTYDFNVSFSVLFLISIIMHLSLLFKLTPGNLGVKQLATGGVFILFGYDASIGVFVSLFQFLTLLLISIPLGAIFSLNNLKHFSAQKLKNIFKSEQKIKDLDVISDK